MTTSNERPKSNTCGAVSPAVDEERKKQHEQSRHNSTHRHSTAAWLVGQALRFLGWMTGIGGFVAWSTCPFCGRPGCPVGAGTAGVIGGLFALCMTNWKRLIKLMKNALKKSPAHPAGGVCMNAESCHTTIRVFGVFDVFLIIGLVAAAGYSFKVIGSVQSAGTVKVFRDSRLIAQYPLDEERRFSVNGAEGPVEVEIRNGKARVIASCCKNQLCVHSAPVSKAGGQIVCAPNHVMVTVEGGRDTREGVDAIAR